MAVSRRNLVLGIGGSGLALVAAGGLFAVTRTPDRALAAWGAAATPEPAIRLDAFRHAILAPNPHNRQPWLIQLVGQHEAIIFCDLDRRLPATDPFDRQILIGFGCFLEVARIAAAERGWGMDVTAFPQGLPGERLDRRAIARLRFVPNGAAGKDRLFAAIAARRSAKLPFDATRHVAPAVLAALGAHAETQVSIATSADSVMVQTLRALTWDAWSIELATQRTWQESVDLIRIGKAEIEANPDGIALGGAFLEVLAATGQLSRAQMARPGTVAYNAGIDRYRPILATGMAYAWVTTAGNSRLDQLAAGRAYVRMNLEATQQGLGFHPVSQALQEFPEMARPFADIHARLGAPVGGRVQMLARLGYGATPAAAPRWPMASRMIGT